MFKNGVARENPHLTRKEALHEIWTRVLLVLDISAYLDHDRLLNFKISQAIQHSESNKIIWKFMQSLFSLHLWKAWVTKSWTDSIQPCKQGGDARKIQVLLDNFPRSVCACAFKSVILFHFCTETILSNLTQHVTYALTNTHPHSAWSFNRGGRHASRSGGLPMALPFPLALSVGFEHLPQAEL